MSLETVSERSIDQKAQALRHRLGERLAAMPIIAILRGITPDAVEDVGAILVDAGITIIEVPLNSPNAMDSIGRLAQALKGRAVVGAGTVLTPMDVDRVVEAGGEIIVSPDCHAPVIRRAIALGVEPMPGFATASEAFSALRAGARFLKLFPAASYGRGHISALKAVLPDDVRVLAVGGVGPDHLADWAAAGADGFGIGTGIYKPGLHPDAVAKAAAAHVAAWHRHVG
ncbi:2-dehydro-3-deoxy-6-phosphogalactonate aldolase [alpha proteobacterium Q-1]|nr:2-dehydro-3-deoxy-6-phosphogalactonate aldolase [alpha proteobacterium Q-1]